MTSLPLDRRRFLALAGATAALSSLPPLASLASGAMPTRTIPSSGEAIPVMGMGTWKTFSVGSSERLRHRRLEVLKTFFDLGGGMVDSSPMYGSAEEVMGWCRDQMGEMPALFSATKVWTRGRDQGVREMEDSRQLWKVPSFDLMQIHNLLDWETHLETLQQMKADGQVRYIGITTSHGLRHEQFEQIMAREPLDFVQLTYNVLDREPEKRLLPLAREKGIAVIVNRPFQRGSLFDHIGQAPLPSYAAEFGAQNWAQFLLKFILAHPDVTCIIPATTQVEHMRENMAAAHGPLPDKALLDRMIRDVESL